MWIEQTTGLSDHDWVVTIQTLIGKYSSASDDPQHDQTDVKGWMQELTEFVMKSFPVTGPAYDENMRIARVMSYILALWYSRLHLAKVSDPRRPVSIRRDAYKSRQEWLDTLFHAITDIQHDPSYFPGQQWEHPFSLESQNGDFI